MTGHANKPQVFRMYSKGISPTVTYTYGLLSLSLDKRQALLKFLLRKIIFLHQRQGEEK